MFRKFTVSMFTIALARTTPRLAPKTMLFRAPVNSPSFGYYFSSDKKGKQSNPQDKKQAEKEQVKNNDNNEVKNNEGKKVEKKLTQLSNQQLIDLNTQQSIKIVNLNIKKMEETRARQEKQLKQLNQKMQFLQKHHNQSATKQQQLLQNIKMQEQELKRIKVRADKQIQVSKDYGITKLAKQMLQVADNIKRCKVLVEQKLKTEPADEYYQKIVNLNQQMQQFFKLYGIQQFDPINQPFDPNTAQGLVTIPTPPGYQKNNVATTMMTGYRIKSRLLRSAKVGIFV